MCAFLELGNRPVLPANTRTKLLEDAFLTRLPIAPASVLEYTVELFLSLPPALLDGRNQILFVCMAKITGDVRVLQSLQWRESVLCVQVGYGTCKGWSIDMGLGKEVVPESD